MEQRPTIIASRDLSRRGNLLTMENAPNDYGLVFSFLHKSSGLIDFQTALKALSVQGICDCKRYRVVFPALRQAAGLVVG